jgi:hypothetical protein
MTMTDFEKFEQILDEWFAEDEKSESQASTETGY